MVSIEIPKLCYKVSGFCFLNENGNDVTARINQYSYQNVFYDFEKKF
jgi:hypothetical protein